MFRSKLVVQSLATLMLASGSIVAMGRDSGWYVGAALGQSNADIISAGELKSGLEAAGATGVVTSVDNTDTGWKLFGGYRFNKNIGVEAAYVNLGSLTGNATYATLVGSPLRLSADADGFLYSVVGTLPVSGAVAVFGKVGIFAWNVDATGTASLVPFNASGDGTDLAYGLGVNWKISKSLGLRTEWERFQDLSDVDVDLLSLGATFHF